MKAEDRSVCVFCSLGSRPFKVGEMEFFNFCWEGALV